MRAVYADADSTLFVHPADSGLSLSWTAGSASLSVSNNTVLVNYYDTMIQGTEELASVVDVVTKDLAYPGDVVSVSGTDSGAEAHGWYVIVTAEDAAGPGFIFQGSGWQSKISGLVTYWR